MLVEFDESLSLPHSFGFIYLEWEDASKKLQKEIHERLSTCKAVSKPSGELRKVETSGIRLTACAKKWNKISNDDRLLINEYFRARFDAEQKANPTQESDTGDI